ncbi:hypothetical protein DICVIV_10901 [Dictyocaulus viviparus]|uniref:PiggyBac transposable element-derived protein domain-containing protein n=1 Tax=Dictyocaulus viviparus TaxID=29172 RepID=A0A0D8XH70_DICVI|nr:hypothetical protein DICVIV_10901 [Dictyocaulus viviparus]
MSFLFDHNAYLEYGADFCRPLVMSAEGKLKFLLDRFLIETGKEAENSEESHESVVLLVDEESEDSDVEIKNEFEDNDHEWSDNVMSNDPWIFDDSQCGVNKCLLIGCTEPVHFYELFMTDVWDLVVNETNKYGQEKDQTWESTTVEEMKRFIGLCLQMGIVRLPRLRDYWSTSPAFGSNPIGAKVMVRDRFEKLLTYLHFADNTNYDEEDIIYKATKLIQTVNRNCKRVFKPGKKLCINVSLVPLRGKVAYCQYTSHKRYKCGIKVFKLCTTDGYTYRIKVCSDKDASGTVNIAEAVVFDLMDDLLDEGRHLYTNTRNTSISLAERLLHRKTHLIGMCKRNTKGLPKRIINQNLKAGETIAYQNKNGVMVLKWKDKEDIIMISTIHDAAISTNSSKPKVVESYNRAKFEGMNDKMTPYIQLFFHLVTQTCLVNAWMTFCDNVQKITLDDFKIQVYLSYIQNANGTSMTSTQHFLEGAAGPEPKKWRRCVGCYKRFSKDFGYKSASKRAKQVSTRNSSSKGSQLD